MKLKGGNGISQFEEVLKVFNLEPVFDGVDYACAFARVRIRCLDSLAEHIDFCSDKCHKCSENVRCPTVILSSVHVSTNTFFKLFLLLSDLLQPQ